MKPLNIVIVILALAACGGSGSTSVQPITGRYAGTPAGCSNNVCGPTSLFIDRGSYSLSFGAQQAEAGSWSLNGNQITLTDPNLSINGSPESSTLTVGDGTLDGYIFASQRHFIRTGP